MSCSVLLMAAILISAVFNQQYAGFFAPFLALVLGATAERLRLLAPALIPAAAILLVVGFIAFNTRYVVRQSQQPLPTAEQAFAPNACVLSDRYDPLILDDRYNLYEAGCPPVLDTFGYMMLDNAIVDSASSRSFQASWLSWLPASMGSISRIRLSTIRSSE